MKYSAQTPYLSLVLPDTTRYKALFLDNPEGGNIKKKQPKQCWILLFFKTTTKGENAEIKPAHLINVKAS